MWQVVILRLEEVTERKNRGSRFMVSPGCLLKTLEKEVEGLERRRKSQDEIAAVRVVVQSALGERP